MSLFKIIKGGGVSRVSNRNSVARNCAKLRATVLELRAILRSLQGSQLRASKIHLRWKPYLLVNLLTHLLKNSITLSATQLDTHLGRGTTPPFIFSYEIPPHPRWPKMLTHNIPWGKIFWTILLHYLHLGRRKSTNLKYDF